MKKYKGRLSKCLVILMVITLLAQPVMSFATTSSSIPTDSFTATEVIPISEVDEVVEEEDVGTTESTEVETESSTDVKIETSEPSTEVEKEPSTSVEVTEETTSTESDGEDKGIIEGLLDIFKTNKDYGVGWRVKSISIPGCRYGCGKFKVDTTDYGEHLAVCGQHSKNPPSEGSKVKIKDIDSVSRDEKNIYKALYYGYGGPGEKVSHDNAGWIKTSMALSKANGNIGSNTSYDDWYKKLSGYNMPSENFKVYRVEFSGSVQDLFFFTWNPKGNVKISKTSTNASEAKEANGYSLKGAVYGIYTKKACTAASRVKKLTTNDDGDTPKVTLKAGTYYVKEISAPDGFKLNTYVTKVVLKDGSDKTVNVVDAPKKGSLQVYKQSEEPEITDNNNKYSLKGAKYGVYLTKANANNDKKRVTTLTTDEDGYTEVYECYADTYYVKEVKASNNFKKDPKVYTLKVEVGKLNTKQVAKSKEPFKLDPVQILLYKKNSEGLPSNKVGDAELAGAEFTIDYYKGVTFTKASSASNYSKDRSWKFKTDEDGYVMFTSNTKYFISGSEFYKVDGIEVIPPGTIVITETKAPKGYQKDTTKYVANIDSSGGYGQPVGNKLVVPTVLEPLIYGDVEVKKIDSITKEPLKGVKFDIVLKSSGKVVRTITTDSTGYATTKKSDKPDGSLPYGKYIIKEVEYPDNYIPAGDKEFSITTSGQVVKNLTFENKPAQITTTAKDKTFNSQYAFPSGTTEIVDTVNYKNLRVGEDYHLKGILMDKSTGEPFVDADGSQVTGFAEFTPTKADGSVDVTYKFSSSGMAGKSVVVFEELYLELDEDILVASHKDINYAGQTVTFYNPKISTYATVNGGKVADKTGNITVVDTVSYSGLVPNVEYVLKGQIYDKGTKEAILIGDSIITGTTTFKPTSAEGKVNVEFTFDASKFTGDEFVIGEELYLASNDEDVIAKHIDMNDANQTIYFPSISTSAINKDTGTRTAGAKAVTIVDTVSYKGLEVGKTYKLKASIVNKNGNKLVDGFEKTFTPTAKDGKVSIDLHFNAIDMAGKSVVVFEELYFGDTLLASHKDVNDVKQTISIPKISTSAIETSTGTKNAPCEGKITIKDTVSYSGLVAGESYTLKGTLMNKSGGVYNGIEKSTTFTPSSSKGTEVVTFSFDVSDLKGKSLVVYEELYSGGKLVASHRDINDENQTIHFPSISTTAIDKVTKEHIANAENGVVIVDTVAYTNLIKDQTYTLSGILMDKETGATIKVGGKEITATKKFTASGSTGSETMQFNLNASSLKGKSVVVYETLSIGDVVVAKHKDINDINQTVHFPTIITNAVDSKTSTNTALADKSMSILDLITYKNLIPNKTYTVKGILMDKDTGNPVLVDGKQVTKEVNFKPTTANGSLTVEYKFDGSGLKGKTLVIFETVYLGTNPVAVHKDINDGKQTIYIPGIGTTAIDKDTGMQNSLADEEITVVDTVDYRNLVPGKEYVVTGKLVDKATGDVLQVKGKEVTASKKFTPEKANGSIALEFTFNGSGLKNTTLVAFENVSLDGKDVAVHADINDVKQTVYIPEIGTKALDKETNSHNAMAGKDVTIVDTVSYKNLIVGKTYKVSGVLMDKGTGSPLLVGGNQVKAEKEFTPEKTDGTVSLEFTFDGSALQGQTVVAFETVTYNGKEVAVHSDIQDEDQTVYFPSIGTVALDADTNTSFSKAGKSVTIKDTVTYKGLLKGSKYKLVGTLVDTATGNKLEGVVSEKEFTAEDKAGSVVVEFTLDTTSLKGRSVVVFEELYKDGKLIATHADITDLKQTIFFPEIGTSAIDGETKTHFSAADKEVTVIDTVTYKGLKPNLSYTVKGTIMDKVTGNAVKVDGSELTAEAVFTPTKSNGTVDVEFTFDGRSLEGKAVVVFEELFRDELKVASHEDITDEKQTIYFPEIGTTAVDKETKDHISSVKDGNVTIVDTVKYAGLKDGGTYKLVGKVMDKETGNVLVIGGKEVTVTKEFVGRSSGSELIEFTFNSKTLAGKDVVVFEELYSDNNLLAVHKDINDEGQTVEFPSIGTTAKDGNNGTQSSNPLGTVTIIDTVHYNNLIPGKSYTVTGVLKDKATGEALEIDGGTIVAKESFTPDKPNGSVDVKFTFNASALAGKTVVAFETLSYNGVDIAVHADINDFEQSIFFPEIGTTALDKESNHHNSLADEEITIIDTVTYKNLIKGQEYKVSGVLMDKATGEKLLVDGKEVTAEKIFTADDVNGEVIIEFTFNGSALAGTTVVAFETLYTSNKEIAIHKNIEDKEQTVYIPKIGTTALDNKSNNHSSMPEKEVTIVDTVKYENLLPGKEYKVAGVLMDKATGEEFKVNGESVVVEKMFTPEESSGSVDIEFVFDGTGLEGQTVVAFEKVYLREALVAVHTDIDDEEQSVHFPKVGTTAVDKESGTHNAMADGDVTIVDTLKYENLVPGTDYLVLGVLMNKATGEELKVDGEPVKAEEVFTPESANGTVDIEFKFSGVGLEDSTVVVFEEVYTNGTLVAQHKDIEDADQSIYFPRITTLAYDAESLSSNIKADGNVTITDKVSYENLIDGQEYTIRGILIDKATGEPLLIDGEEVTSSLDFTHEEPKVEESEESENTGEVAEDTQVTEEEGTGIGDIIAEGSETNDTGEEVIEPEREVGSGVVSLDFTFDGSGLDGSTVVVYETLYTNDSVVAEHKDINDGNQTVFFTDLSTCAYDKDTESQRAYEQEETTIVDTVMYKNLIPGKEYLVKTSLVLKSTGEVIEGTEVESTFIPDSASGSEEVEIIFNSTGLAGEKVVVFEKILLDGVEVGSHEDIEDREQTVEFMNPEIRTTLVGDGEAKEIEYTEKDIKLVDTVSYKGLVPGVRHVVIGNLVDKATGEEISYKGDYVQVTAEFIPAESNGTVDVEFTLNVKELGGKKLVAFEEVHMVKGTEEDFELVKIAEHKDLKDKGQTVYVKRPPIQTGLTQSPLGYILMGLAFITVLAAGIVAVVMRKRRVA